MSSPLRDIGNIPPLARFVRDAIDKTSMTSDSDTAPQFASFFGAAWIVLSIVVGVVLLALFFFGPEFMQAGGALWALIRWIFSPII